jgi:glycosyltransferase involved in cell wall biosynthesis
LVHHGHGKESMNVLVIPSWYPSRKNPLGGIFCRDQAEALAACTDCNIIVCDWGQKDGALSLRHPLEAVRNLCWRLAARRKVRRRHNQFYEFFEPSLLWSPKFPGGGQQRILRAIRRVFKAAQAQFGRIDLLHAHVCRPGGYLAARLSQETGVPLVFTEHWGAFPGPMTGGRLDAEIGLTLTRAAAVICVGTDAAAKMRALGCRKVRVIHNLVDETRFLAKPYPAGIFTFFSLGRLIHCKGFDVLLRAIAQWSPPAGEVELVIGGRGDLKSELQRMATSLGVDRYVRWAGAICRDDAPGYFQNCHAFVLPSRRESFSVVCAEAIACGRPVIATRCGGPEDIVKNENGFLVSPENPGELAAALAAMKQNRARFDPAAIRRDFMGRFSRPVITAQIRALYSEVLA